MHRSFASLFVFVSISVFAQTPQVAKMDSKEELLATAKKYPGLRVQASVGTRNKPVSGSSYMKTMTISPAVVIESAQTQPMAAASITCLLITMDTGDKYRRGEQTCKIATTETIGVPAVLKGSRRKFEFAPLQTRFDSDRDRSNVGGEVYKYFLLAVLSDDGKFLYLETSCPGLDKYLETHPEERVRYVGLKPGVTFSSNFQK